MTIKAKVGICSKALMIISTSNLCHLNVAPFNLHIDIYPTILSICRNDVHSLSFISDYALYS